MLKFLITAVIVLTVYFGTKKLIFEYKEVEQQEKGGVVSSAPLGLEGLPPYLEASLDTAQKQGPGTMREWLKKNRHLVRDPRLAEIELDYVLLVSRDNREEAKRVFKSVKERTPKDSPLAPRINRLAATYD
ncbi:MAG: hypothetical protein SFY81_12885 [Verrucomicrobiota bacterium]|nr:hypothetical protein [Verrucomicrobiota bacterium]